jgi:hypothetical protein
MWFRVRDRGPQLDQSFGRTDEGQARADEGLANDRSLAWGSPRPCEQGAELAFSYQAIWLKTGAAAAEQLGLTC